MDFISGAIIGGLIYDYYTLGLSTSSDIVKVALKDYVLTDNEQLLITQDLEKATNEDKSSKENLEKYFETKAENTNNIVKKYTQNHSGDGDNVMGDKTVYNNYAPSKEEILKKH